MLCDAPIVTACGTAGLALRVPERFVVIGIFFFTFLSSLRGKRISSGAVHPAIFWLLNDPRLLLTVDNIVYDFQLEYGTSDRL
ncbi:hypothetical protein DL98DRAFT_511725 [Cadophora sp. DSE1049]|nr:hypothetical protein DL98DRAFT_511725 [Cadophora sp. DSE1049]